MYAATSAVDTLVGNPTHSIGVFVRSGKDNFLTISEMMDVSGEPAPRPARVRAFMAFILIAVFGGVSLGILISPPLFVAHSMELQVTNAWDALPDELPLDVPLAQHTILLDREGNEFARFYAEDRTPITLDQMSPNIINALIAIEDARFYEHGALDTKGFARAAGMTLLTDKRQGGSTLTQQLVENTLMAQAHDDPAAQRAAKAQSFQGKIQELKYAVKLEETLTKDEILERYLNTVFFGNGAYGVSAAAQRYFSIPASDLTLSQAAMLAGLMRSPTNYDPIKNPDAAKNRRDTVLLRMEETGHITVAERDAAQLEPLTVTITAPPNGCLLSTYPLYCAHVRDTLLSDPVFGETPEEREENLYRGGMTVTTALSRSVTDASQATLSAAISPENRVAIAEAIVEPGTGLISALTQTKPYGQGDNQTEIVYATRPSFQPGSSFKMFTLATAMEQGIDPYMTMTAPTGYTPRNMDAPKGGFSNDSNVSYGALDAYSASRQSVNVYYVKLIEKTGVLPVVEMAKRLGITSIPESGGTMPTARSATFTLGAWEVSPLEMSNAYATIAANGVHCKPTSIISAVRTSSNMAVDVPAPNCHQAIEADVAKLVADILQGPLTEGGTAEGFNLDRPAAGKTGTTNSYAATWFVGFTPQYAAAVWVGDPRGGSAHPLVNVTAFGRKHSYVYGATIAAPVWHDSMQAISTGLPVIPLGAGNVNQSPLKIKSVPDVRGMSTAQAMTTLLAAGYQTSISDTLAAPDPLFTPDRVATQSPASGVNLEAGSKVLLTLTDGSRLDVSAPVTPEALEGN